MSIEPVREETIGKARGSTHSRKQELLERQCKKVTTQRHKGAEGETFACKYGCALAKASRALVEVKKNV